MDIFDEEILKFWTALRDQKVRYIMVGGYAANLHGYQRYTGDIDIWIEDTAHNRHLLRQAFIEYGIGDFPMLETMQFVPGDHKSKIAGKAGISAYTAIAGAVGDLVKVCRSGYFPGSGNIAGRR